MQKPKSGVQYTIRGIPIKVDRALRKAARERGVTLNRLVVEALISASGERRRYRSLKGIAGKWIEDPEFDKALEAQRSIDWDAWS